MRRLKQLEDENAKLKKIVAGPFVAGSRRVLQDVIRQKTVRLCSQARAFGDGGVGDESGRVDPAGVCGVLEFVVRLYHYKSRRREQAGVEARIKEICQTRVRYGYRRVHVPRLQSRRLGDQLEENASDLQRVGACNCAKQDAEAKGQGSCQATIGRAASTSNEIWAKWTSSMTSCCTGQKIRVLTVVDIVQPVLALSSIRGSATGPKTSVATLERACATTVGYPKTMRVDQGTSSSSAGILDLWAYVKGVTLDFSRPAGKPIRQRLH